MIIIRIIIGIIFSSIFLSNILLSSLVGLPITDDKRISSVLVRGVKLLTVAVVTALISYPFYQFLLIPEALEVILPLFVVLIAANASMIANKITVKLKFEEKTQEFDLITPVNAVVIVATLLIITSNQNMLNAIFQTIGLVLGYILITLLIHAIKPRLNLPGVPKAFKGLPILLITLGLFAMILTGLAGIL